MRTLIFPCLLAVAGVTTGYGVRKAYACSCIDFYGEKSEIAVKQITLTPEGDAGTTDDFKTLETQLKSLALLNARGGNKPSLYIAGSTGEAPEENEDRLYLNFEFDSEGEEP